jgi:hypothetical protein
MQQIVEISQNLKDGPDFKPPFKYLLVKKPDLSKNKILLFFNVEWSILIKRHLKQI